MQAAAWFRVTNGLIVTLLVTCLCGVVIWRLREGVCWFLRDISASVFELLSLPPSRWLRRYLSRCAG